MMALPALLALLLGLCGRASSTNPIVDGVGMADPHMHVWPADPSRVFLYSTHDCSPHGRPPCVAAPEAEGQAGAATAWGRATTPGGGVSRPTRSSRSRRRRCRYHARGRC